MNQFFYQITRKVSEIVNSDDYRKRNITRKTAFTRNRKLTFPVMIVLILRTCLHKLKSTQQGL